MVIFTAPTSTTVLHHNRATRNWFHLHILTNITGTCSEHTLIISRELHLFVVSVKCTTGDLRSLCLFSRLRVIGEQFWFPHERIRHIDFCIPWDYFQILYIRVKCFVIFIISAYSCKADVIQLFSNLLDIYLYRL